MKPLTELLRSRTAPTIVALAVLASIMSGCLGDSIGTGTAYVDANCNGVRDPEETPLAGVCNWMSTDASVATPSREDCANEQLQTDSGGIGGWGFFAGLSCNDVYVFAQAPDGFQPTTDTAVNDCHGEFGFAREGTCPPRSIVQPEGMTAGQGTRCLCWGLFLGVGPALFVLGYRKHRSERRHSGSSPRE